MLLTISKTNFKKQSATCAILVWDFQKDLLRLFQLDTDLCLQNNEIENIMSNRVGHPCG